MIPFSVDKDLYLHPQNGKFVVNNIFSVGELDFHGNVAVEMEEFVKLVDHWVIHRTITS